MLNLVLSLSLSHTGHWKFNMAPHGKELSEDLKKRIVALYKDGVGYKKIAKTLKLVVVKERPPPPHDCKALCTAIHNKALYKCIIHSFIQTELQHGGQDHTAV